MGLKPDIMIIVKNMVSGFEYEIAYIECSRICCGKGKLVNDEIKLYRECGSGMDYSRSNNVKFSHELGIIGIQVAGKKLIELLVL